VHRAYDLKEAVEPPTSPTPAGFNDMLSAIESLTNMYRTDCAIALLDMSGPSRAKVLEMVEKSKAATRSDGKGRSISMGSPKQSRGLSFIITIGENTVEAIYEQAVNFATLKKYSERYDEWFGLGWHRDSVKGTDVAIALRFPWQQDAVMEELSKRFPISGTRIDLNNLSGG
jgi:hypothetical protein